MNQLIKKALTLKAELNSIKSSKKAEILRGTNDEYAQETLTEIHQVVKCIDDTIAMIKSGNVEIKEANDLIEDIRLTYVG